jgi:predicted  nucleic acid-binding Zn-ribbon protein
VADKSLGFNIFMDADTKKAEAKVGAFAESMQRRIERAVRSLPEIDLKADASQVDRRIQEIRRELATLATQRIGIDIDAGTAQARIERLRGELVRLGSESPNIQVQADTARAAAALGAVSAQARRLDGETVNVTVNARDAVRTVSMLGLIVAGLSAVSAAAVPAAAALAALPTLGSAAIQGVGTIVAGFSGVGDAVKALGDAETKAAAGTAQSASSRVNSAQAIIGAQRSLESAVTSADRAAITGAQQVADARDQVTATYEQGLDRVASAEADYTRAQEESQTATEDLTRARADAQEQIEDLGRSLRGAALDEREAQIRLAEAQDRLTAARASGTSGREIQKLEIDAEQAALALENAADRRDDLTKEQQKADQLGVNGTDQVVTAQKRADAAAKAVTASEKALGAVRDQATKDNTRAQLQLARTMVPSGRVPVGGGRATGPGQRL